MIENLRNVYMKLRFVVIYHVYCLRHRACLSKRLIRFSRTLTEEEENTAGKFSQVGKRIELARKQLTKKLGRDPTEEEWAVACQMDSPEQLLVYLNLAMQARNRLVQHNIRIVDHWARRLIQHSTAGKDVSYYELVAEGLIGLTKAAECYMPGRVRFYTHA